MTARPALGSARSSPIARRTFAPERIAREPSARWSQQARIPRGSCSRLGASSPAPRYRRRVATEVKGSLRNALRRGAFPSLDRQPARHFRVCCWDSPEPGCRLGQAAPSRPHASQSEALKASAHIHSPQSLSGSSPLRRFGIGCVGTRTAFPDPIGERNAVVVIPDGIDYRIGGQSLPSTPRATNRSTGVGRACGLGPTLAEHRLPSGRDPSPTRTRRPAPFGQSRRALRDRALCNRDFGVSGTLSRE